MAELRLVGVSEDGEHLVLTDGDGTEHTIVIDERLRAGVHGHLSRLGQLTMALESRISPREIQNRVRGGESAEHVAQTAGVPLERVLRFVGPVLREREHVADQARRARLGGTGGPSSLLGDLVARAAQRRGIDEDLVNWDSARREDHTWIVTVGWPDGMTAVWTLDLMRHQATPVDAAARQISGVLEDAAATDARDTVSRDFPDFADSPEFARFDADDTVDITDSDNVHPFVPRAVPDMSDIDDADDADADDADSGAAGEQLPGLADDADAGGADADSSEPSPTADAPVPVPPRAQPARSSRRAKVPKWDDIMFGMKPKDGS
ncbi:MAG: hypothetical protein QOG69_1102 [Actinomycetota bacterium]|nr:hypothetical protein [Actinomycetota bacterium]